jgi:2'-5' RNA ligase
MPPHVTLLYPFVPQAQLDAATVAELRRIVATTSAFEFALTDLGRFPGVLYLAPEPAGPFVALTRAIVERWPEHPPYDGAYDTIVPHLTIVGGREPPSLVVDIEPTLPVLACASEVWVMVEGAGGTWTRHARLPLGSPCA